MQNHPYSLIYLCAALVAGGIAWPVWKRRSAPGALSLFLNMLALSIWSGALALMWASTTLRNQLLWFHISGLGILLAPVTFLTFCMKVSGNGHLVTWRLASLFSVEPLIFLALLWTNETHYLVHSQAQLWLVRGIYELKWTPGPAIWANAIYSYFLFIVGIWLLARSLNQGGRLLHSQIQIILVGACLSLALELFRLTPFASFTGEFNMAPLTFTLAGAIYFYGITRQGLLDLIPVARSRLIESMTDGVIVADLQERVVDINPAAEQFLGVTAAHTIGRKIPEVLGEWEQITRPFMDRLEVRTDIVVEEDINRYVDLVITPLVDSRKRTVGRMIVFRDITSRKRSEAALREANEKLQDQLDEIRVLRDQLRDQATRDPLTNLYNRRYLEESLMLELSRAEREVYPVCLIMLDIDRFKRVNDTCGHKTGDEVLQALAKLLVTHVRAFDVVCRYGGEEFVVVMPRLSAEIAYQRAEFLRREFASLPLPGVKESVRPTLSIGVAIFPMHGSDSEKLIQAADEALYDAKGAGRNRTVVCSDLLEGGVSKGG